MRLLYIFIFIYSLNVVIPVSGQVITSMKGQVNNWTTMNFRESFQYQFGGRFIPELDFMKQGSKINYETQISFNTIGSATFREMERTGFTEKFSPYRAWARLSGNRFELRAGLQKISFGSATMLRPLMWFDRIDPRDPLHLTEGVYGLLGRYYFPNNANVWLWGLYGNNKTKGWEAFTSVNNKPEIGGRFQFPVPDGEVALSIHTRNADLSSFFADSLIVGSKYFNQNKYALDGKWDIGPGAWMEYVVTHNAKGNILIPYRFMHALNLGIDYTFGIGNGLTSVGEIFYIRNGNTFTGKTSDAVMNAISLNYPLGLMDDVTAMVYYNWDQNDWYRFVNFKRTYDFWTIYLMLYWNPGTFDLYNFTSSQNLFVGKGLQLMIVYNF
ncbi:MAG: hypothetical protein ACOC10_10715 [Bacteroidota bacterium]